MVRARGATAPRPYHDFYVWADEKPAEKPGDVVFPDREDSNWAYDPKARQWYLHRFYSHQPDLNVANPEVRDEIAQVVGYWLTQGLAGFRVDAVPFMLEPIGMPEGALHDPHELLRDLRRFIGRRRGDAILMGEVNLPPDQQRAFFGDEDGDELHMVLSFVINQAMYLSLARGDATPLREALAALPAIPEDCQWANFVRNHDELTLDKLAEDERDGGVRRVRARGGRFSSTAAGCGGACRRWSAGTSAGSACSTASPSRSPAPRCCSTARRSAWPRTSRSRAATACGRRCSGPRTATAASRRPRTRTRCAAPWSPPRAGGPTA